MSHDLLRGQPLDAQPRNLSQFLEDAAMWMAAPTVTHVHVNHGVHVRADLQHSVQLQLGSSKPQGCRWSCVHHTMLPE
jgi:hypothetical protein